MQQAVKKSAPALPLKDMKLFRQQCYINGKWVDADSGKTIDGHQPGDRRGARHRAADGRRRDAPRHRGGRRAPWPAWRAQDRQGARRRSCAAGST